ncbi:MAG: hypothetical protein LBU70_01165 [Chitinispirillales bacterium]|jgi:hypothetical protein|nr:hypothetical protein [Chitinispirillales bacterium]
MKNMKYRTDEDDAQDENSENKAAAMVVWTKRTAFFLGFCAFIVMFLVSYDFMNFFDTKVIVVSIIKSLCAFLLFWVGGLIIGNILLKGLIADIPVDQAHLVDGGILQRVYLYQQRLNYDLDGNVILVDPRTDQVVRKADMKDKKDV